MRCYLTIDGRMVRTQAEAGATWTKLDLPDDQVGRLELYNALTTRGDPGPWSFLLDAVCPSDPTITPSAPPPVQPAPTAAPMDPSLTDVEAFIQRADHRQLASVTENAILRMRELGREAGL